MKTSYLTIMVLMAVLVLWPGVTDAVAEKADQAEMGRGRWHGPVAMSEERIERILNRIEQTNPEKAKELARLREEDPNEFQKQLREHFRKEFGERHRQRRTERMGREQGHRGREQMVPSKGGGKGPLRDRMWEKHTKFMGWLTENYPDEANRLKQLQQKDDEAYFEELRLAMKTYRSIMQASTRNPELAGVLKEDLRLREERRELLAEIKAATDEDEKQQLKNQLEKVVAERFELIIKRKQVRYEEMLGRLERLKEQVKERKNEVDSLKSQKADKVKERLEELLGGTEKVDWD